MKALGIPVHFNEIILPRILHHQNPYQEFILFRKLIQFLKVHNFDIINLHLPAARLFGRLATLLAKKGRVISVIHGNEVHHERLTNWIDDTTICVSRTIKTFLISHGISAEKLTVIHNGIDLDQVDTIPEDKHYLHRELNLPLETKIVGMVAYFYGPSPAVHKGHEFFFDAAKLITNTYSNVHFVVIGDNRLVSNERERFEAYVAELGIMSRVHFLGEREDVLQIMSSFSIHVLPSLKEGFGMVLLEAMARGVPNIASGIGSISEIIIPHQTGLLFKPGDHVQLSKLIFELLENPQESMNLGLAGRLHCQELFNAQRMVDEYERAFKSIL